MQIKTTLKRFLADESGASMAEYALLLGVVVVALVAAAGFLKDDIATLMGNVGNNIATAD
jgi:pilus assembly protein Flp/PilA